MKRCTKCGRGECTNLQAPVTSHTWISRSRPVKLNTHKKRHVEMSKYRIIVVQQQTEMIIANLNDRKPKTCDVTEVDEEST